MAYNMNRMTGANRGGGRGAVIAFAVLIAAVLGVLGIRQTLSEFAAGDAADNYPFAASGPITQPQASATAIPATTTMPSSQTAQERNDAINSTNIGDCIFYTSHQSDMNPSYVDTVEKVACSSSSATWRVTGKSEAHRVGDRGKECSGEWIATEDWIPGDGLDYTYLCLARV